MDRHRAREYRRGKAMRVDRTLMNFDLETLIRVDLVITETKCIAQLRIPDGNSAGVCEWHITRKQSYHVTL